MKTFKDLEFKKHPIASGKMFKDAKQALMNFENGFGVSVVLGNCFYSNDDDTYEVAVMFKNSVCFTTHITNSVIGFQTQEDVSEIMKQVQEL